MPDPTVKTCQAKRRPSCGQTKPLTAFVKSAKRADGHDNVCTGCHSGARRQNYDPSKRRANHLSFYYGLTLGAYDRMREQQHYPCAICDRHETALPAIQAGRPATV